MHVVGVLCQRFVLLVFADGSDSESTRGKVMAAGLPMVAVHLTVSMSSDDQLDMLQTNSASLLHLQEDAKPTRPCQLRHDSRRAVILMGLR